MVVMLFFSQLRIFLILNRFLEKILSRVLNCFIVSSLDISCNIVATEMFVVTHDVALRFL
jgi:hypothetical protein